MSTVIARSVASTPKRSATETWEKIIAIIAPDTSDPARAELGRVSGVASSIISAEAPKNAPMVVFGGGPRVRIYCLYNEDAHLADGSKEGAVKERVTGDGWRMSLPCEEDDLDWVNQELKSLSSRVTARVIGSDAPTSEDNDDTSNAAEATAGAVNTEEFFKP